MNTVIKDKKDATVENICDIESDANETSNTLENTSSNFWNDLIFHNESNSDDDIELGDNSEEKIDNSIRTLENVDPNHSKISECDISVIKIKMRSDLFNDNSQQVIDLVEVDNNNHGELTEHLIKNTHDNGGTSITLFYPFKVKTEESIDKHVSNTWEQLSTHIENFHSINTNDTDRQVNRSTAKDDISNQKINSKTTVENSENITQNNEGYKSSTPMVVIQENQMIIADDKRKIRKLNNLSENSYLQDHRDNKVLMKCMAEMKKEKIEVLPDLPNLDLQEQEQPQLPEGWKRETVLRSRKKKMDVYYVSPTGIRLRSESEVYQYCEQEGLKLDFSIFDFGYEEANISDSDNTITLSEEDSSDDQVVWASTGHFRNNIQRGTKRPKESSTKTSQMSKRIYLGHDIVLMPKVIPYEITVNAKQGLPEFLKNYTVLCYDDYLAFRSKEQFWQEPFMKRIYQAIDDREMTIAEASELVDAQYSKLTYEYSEFTKNPCLTEAFSEYLGEKEERVSANHQDESSSQNKLLEPIKAALPNQIIPSTSRQGASVLSDANVSTNKTLLPPRLYPTTDLDLRIKKCSCKKSQCLKQSCECFNNFQQCINCKCKDCHNKDKDPKREIALKKRLRKMYPLLSKDLSISNTATIAAAVAVEEMMTKGKQAKKKSLHKEAAAATTETQPKIVRNGCTCLRTACDKRNCGCYAAGLNCSDSCLCMKCSNRITGNSIFNNMHPTRNLPLNLSSSVSPNSRVESVTDTIQRLFPQAYPCGLTRGMPRYILPKGLTTESSSSRLINLTQGVSSYVPNNGTNIVSSAMPSRVLSPVRPNVIPCVEPSDRQTPTNNSMGSSSAPDATLPNQKLKGFENKEAFLSKWVEANFRIDNGYLWEENLIVRHLRNTTERLGLKHTITLSQLRKTMRSVFGDEVGPAKSLHYSPWMYAGIKPVLAYQAGQGNDIYTSVVPTASPSCDTPGTPLTILSTENHDKSLPGTFNVDEDMSDIDFLPVISEVSGGDTDTQSTALRDSDADFRPLISEVSGSDTHTQSTPLRDSTEELINITDDDDEAEFSPVISEVLGGDKQSTPLRDSTEELINITDDDDEAEFSPVISKVLGDDKHSTPLRESTEELINITDDDDDESLTDKDYCPTISNIIGGDKNSTHLPDSTVEQNNLVNEETFCPVIEDVYSEPNASQTARSKQVQLLSTTGSLGMAYIPMVVPQVDEVAENVDLPDATLITNPSETTVAKTVEVGVRVQRGPDWIHCEEDGHGIGTVTELSKKGTVKVVWDCDKLSEGWWYNMGLDGEYRLSLAVEAPRLTVPELLPSSMLVRPPDLQMDNPASPSLGNLTAPALANTSFTNLPMLPITIFYTGSTS